MRTPLDRPRPRSIPACAGEPAKTPHFEHPSTVYPRVCGGTSPCAWLRYVSWGLSPRVRGNPIDTKAENVFVGSIPACAGEPTTGRRRRTFTTVYPRVCGGTVLSWPSRAGGWGLSPRVRGNQRQAGGDERLQRSIPACAGEPFSLGLAGLGVGVYLRVCGGTRFFSADVFEVCGLSPRVRGNPCRLNRNTTGARSIPACAGEPVEQGQTRSRQTVYPRVCGGTFDRRKHGIDKRGLSPRVRGNQEAVGRRGPQERSIPACAGEPAPPRVRHLERRVYPRVCGGTVSIWKEAARTNGLSPRVRGNPPLTGTEPITYRSIPACAGEPRSAASCRCTAKVYPRVCGGTFSAGRTRRPSRGLSPRVRGNRRSATSARHSRRSIPACAGEPSMDNSNLQTNQVYPRVCGGTYFVEAIRAQMHGLSPRVRGNHEFAED